MQLKELKQGEFFTRKNLQCPTPKQVWIKYYYDRKSKTYCCYNFDDISRYIFLKGTTVIYTDFIF